MKRVLKISGIVLAVVLVLLSWPAWQFYQEIEKARSEDPLVWENDVRELESASMRQFAKGEGIVFIGSSSIRLWSSLQQDMAPLPVIRHGFGGAKLNDVVFYAPRLVSAFTPKAVVVFAGTNDIDPNASKRPEVLLASYQAFVLAVREQQPQVPIFYIAITPSLLRWSVWPQAQETNALIAQWSATQQGLHLIDTAPALLGDDGQPLREHYRLDGLHLSEMGYAAWTRIIRPRLETVLSVTDIGKTAAP
ncbi:MAG: hypothetical protein ACI9NT_002801 [Bacteroidia bacterium]|jgi:hypothetical protein